MVRLLHREGESQDMYIVPKMKLYVYTYTHTEHNYFRPQHLVECISLSLTLSHLRLQQLE